MLHLLGCGIETGHVELELRFGFYIQVEALAVVHIHTISYPRVLYHRAVAIDGVVGCEPVAVARECDSGDSWMALMAVVHFDICISLS